MPYPTLDEMEARAQRQLDGMTVNRDAMARDNLALVKIVRSMQAKLKIQDGGFHETFKSVFQDIFGGL